VCAIYATRDVHELSTGKAAAVVLIPVAVITVIVALILTTHLIDTMEKYDEQYTEIMPMVEYDGNYGNYANGRYDGNYGNYANGRYDGNYGNYANATGLNPYQNPRIY